MSKTIQYAVTVDSSGVVTGFNTAAKAADAFEEKLKTTTATTETSAGVYVDANGRMRDANGKFVKSGADVVASNQTLGGSFSSLIGGFTLGTMAANALTSAFTAVKSGIVDAANLFGRVQSAMNELSAITGIAGDDLSYLGQVARENAMATGVSIEKQIEAYKLLASNIDVASIGGVAGLQAVQREVVKLSQASNIDLATAANVVAGTLNQFSLSADEAQRVVNVLAAGSKYGAAEVADLGMSVKESGTSMALAGQSVETTVAALEVLSQNFVKGSEAGTGLRNVITIMQTESEKLARAGITNLNVRSDGFAASLAKLAPLLGDATALVDIFGRENLSAAQILIQNASAVAEMESKVSGTNTAFEQASIQQQGYEAALRKLQAAWEGSSVTLFERFEPALTRIILSTASLVANTETYLPVLLSAGAAIGAYTLITQGAIIATKAAQIATQLWNAALAANPLGLVVAGLAAVVAWVATNEKAMQGFTLIAEGTWDVLKQLFLNLPELALKSGALLFEAMKSPYVLVADIASIFFTEIRNNFSSLVDGIKALLFDFDTEAAYDHFSKVGAGIAAKMTGSFEERGAALQTKVDELSATVDFSNAATKFKEGGALIGKAFSEAVTLKTPATTPVSVATTPTASGQATNPAPGSNANAEIVDLNTIAGLRKAIADARERYEKANSALERANASKAKKELEDQLKKMEEGAATEGTNLQSIAGLRAAAQAERAAMEQASTDADRARHNERLQAIQTELDAKLAGMDIEEFKKQEAHLAEMDRREQLLQAGMQGSAALDQLTSALFARRISNIEREKAAVLSRYDAQLRKEGLSEQERAKLLSQRESAEKSYEEKIRNAKRAGAIADKIFASSQIVFNTGLAVMKSVAAFPLTGGQPWSGYAKVLGAIQLAAVAAQPIPYAFGGLVPVSVSNGEYYFSPEQAAANLPMLRFLNERPENVRQLLPGKINGPGTGTSDSISAYAEPGSFILNAASSKAFEQASSSDVRFGGAFKQGGEVNSFSVQASAPAFQQIDMSGFSQILTALSDLLSKPLKVEGTIAGEDIRLSNERAVKLWDRTTI